MSPFVVEFKKLDQRILVWIAGLAMLLVWLIVELFDVDS